MGERFGVEKLTMNLFDPSGLAGNIPRGTDVARTGLHTHAHSIARLELARPPAHGSPHFSSNSACFRSISSRVRMFFFDENSLNARNPAFIVGHGFVGF